MTCKPQTASPAGFILLLLLLVFVEGCGVNIETGPPTVEEQQDISENRGKAIRSDWSARFERSSTFEKADMLRVFIDSVTANYFRFGQTVARQWWEGNDGRGTAVPDSEIRQLVANSIEDERPILKSYEDIIEYAMDRFGQLRVFDASTDDRLRALVDHYYDVYSAVFYPSGTLADYEELLAGLQTDSERLSLELREAIESYR